MRTDKKRGLPLADNALADNALAEMRARLALLNAAISALQCYQEYSDTSAPDDVRLRPFLVARRKDDVHAEKAS
jgi:hypothetical protein